MKPVVSSQNFTTTSLLLAALYLFLPGNIQAAGITIGSGGSIQIGSGSIHLGCGDLVNHGTLSLGTGVIDVTDKVSTSNQLNGNSGLLEFGGNWSNSGAFEAGTSTISVVDECGDGSITFDGSTEFYNLSMVTTAGKTVYLESGAEQSILNNLVFKGAAGSFLTLRSSIPNEPTFTSLDPGGTQLIDWVDVANNFADFPYQHIAPDIPSAFNSVDRGGNFRWFIYPPIPTLSGLGTLLLAALMLFGAGLARRKYI